MGFHIQLRVNLVKSRKQISKHQNQGYWKFVRKIKEKNTSAELSGCRNVSHKFRIVRVPNCLGAEVSWCRIVPVPKCLAFHFTCHGFCTDVSLYMYLFYCFYFTWSKAI